MEIINKINEDNKNNFKLDIEQILPDYITSEIILKLALCIKAKKKDTALILSKLKKNNLLLDKIYLKNINYHHKNISKEYQKPNTSFETNKDSEYKEFEGNFFKRVKKFNKEENLIAISFIEDLDYKKITKENLIKDYELKEEDFLELDIPCTESISNEQWVKSNSIWPQCNFISSKEKYIYNHNEKEKKEILDLFNNNILNNEDISCLLYDPKTKIILANAKKDEKSVIGHDIMNLLDFYSKNLVDKNNVNKHESKEIDKDKEEDIKYLKLGEKNPIGPKENEDLLNQIDNSLDNNHQYYCEGLFVLTKEEPCMMCAMALIHNRISRIYFSDYNEKEGALVSKYSLDNYNLNHHYLIFHLK